MRNIPPPGSCAARAAALALAVSLCAGAAWAARRAGAQTGAARLADYVGRITALQGRVWLRRKGWPQFMPVIVGTELRPGDRLRLAGSSRATVVCQADWSERELARDGEFNVPCRATAARGVIRHGGTNISPLRSAAPEDAIAPAVLSPRRTRILDPRPLLRWTPRPGARFYEVSLRGTGWRARVESRTELAYPADAPALVPGESYRLVVSAGGRSSDEETAPGLGFTVLDADEAREVRDAEVRIRSLKLGDAQTRLLVADLYAAHDLNAEAEAALAPLAGAASDAAVSRSLGDLHIKTWLPRAAERNYLHSLSRARAALDTEGEASAEESLGAVYDALGNFPEARRRFQSARRIFRRLGDREAARRLAARLAGLPDAR